jgi:hypothetical protein
MTGFQGLFDGDIRAYQGSDKRTGTGATQGDFVIEQPLLPQHGRDA